MTKQDFFEEISTNLFFDIEEYVDVDNIESYDQLYEELDNAGAFEQEVIYYTNAIDFLKKNDASLNESLEIAEEYGYQVKDLNSEILATILKTKLCRQDFFVLEGDINEFLENLEDIKDCSYCGHEMEIDNGDFCSAECARGYESDIH